MGYFRRTFIQTNEPLAGQTLAAQFWPAHLLPTQLSAALQPLCRRQWLRAHTTCAMTHSICDMAPSICVT